MKKIILFYSVIVLLFSCTKPNTENMNLDGVFNYKWNSTINEIELDFNKNKYSNIETKEESINADLDYNGIPSEIFISFYNNEILSGGISVSNLKDIKKEKFIEIENKILSILNKKYGEPQNYEEEIEDENDQTRKREWRFKNNCKINFYSKFWISEILEMNFHYMGFSFLNDNLIEEKRITDKIKAEEERKLWLVENRDLIKGKLTSSRDEFNNITWIQSIYDKEGNILDKLYLYIGTSDISDNIWLRLAINHRYSYERSFGPLYLREYQFNIDGTNRWFEPRSSEIDFDNRSSYTYYENMDINIEGRKASIYDLTEVLNDIANSERTIIRFRGRSRYTDRDITKAEKNGIQIILLAYEYLKKGGKLEDIL